MRRLVGLRLSLTQKILLIIALALVPTFAALPSWSAAGLSVQELIELKQLGFNEEAIKEEIGRSEAKYELTEGDARRLLQLGFSVQFVDYLRSLRPRKRLRNEDIIEMQRRGLLPEQILREMVGAEHAFESSPRDALDLVQKHRVPKVVVRAMQDRPLSLDDLKQLAADKTPEEQLVLLLDIVGADVGALGPAEALGLLRAGVPKAVIGRLRRTPASKSAAVDLPAPGYFPHPLNLFTLRYPSHWRLIKEIADGQTQYAVTPETGVDRIDQLRVGVQVLLMGVDKEAVVAGMPPAEALAQLLPLVRQAEPGLAPVGGIGAARLGELTAARQSFQGTLQGREGRFRADAYLAVRSELMALVVTLAPLAAFAEQEPSFARILDDSSFLPQIKIARPTKPFTPQEIAARYRQSVVSVVADLGDGRISFGTGFIVHEDGYVLTNHHVIWDDDKGRPAKSYSVEWDEDLKLPKLPAELVAYKFTTSTQRVVSWGTDVALLKLPAGRTYQPLPLTPAGEVHLGDPVLTMGFPARDVIETLSTIVTSGIVTRLNKDFTGHLESVYIDAVIAHGNSGGPAIDLATGGAFGLNTFGTFGIRGQENLWNYFGVIPIDLALHEFPLATRVSTARRKLLDFVDYCDLAQRSSDQGAGTAAVRMAQQAVKLAEHSADARSLLGQLQLKMAADEGQIKTGLETLQQALRLDPNHLDTLSFLALAKMQLDEMAEALSYADRAVSAHPDDWQAYETRARVHLAAKRFDNALSDLARAKQLSRDVVPTPYLLAGEAYFGMQRYQEGKREYQRAIEIHPANLEARMGMGRFFTLTGNPLGALLEYDKLNRERPGIPMVLAAIAEAYTQVKKPDKGLEFYLEAIDRARKLGTLPAAKVYLQAGRVAAQLEKELLAVKLYTACLANYFEDLEHAFEAHFALARLVAKAELLKPVAIGHLTYALTIREDDARAKELLQQIGRVRMSKAAIKSMLADLRYPAMVAADIIAVVPLDFAVQTKQEVAELLKEFPGIVVSGILQSQKNFQDIQKQGAGEQTTGRRGAVPDPVVGAWLAQLYNQQTGQAAGSLQLVFGADGRYQAVTRIGQQSENESGVVVAQGDALMFQNDDGERSTCRYQLTGQELVITFPELGQLRFKRVR
jgi:tetratricopeptide (TPR) repeat protein/S1-C subfamily serine protease